MLVTADESGEPPASAPAVALCDTIAELYARLAEVVPPVEDAILPLAPASNPRTLSRNGYPHMRARRWRAWR